MTVLEGMKELKLIVKRMGNNTAEIQKLSSQPSNIKPLMAEGADAQRKKIRELAQANEDLAKRYILLNAKINYTNLFTTVEIEGVKYSLNDLLQYRRILAKSIEGGYVAMNDNNFTHQTLASSRQGGGYSGDVTIERYYDETFKQNQLEKWQTFYHNIDSRLEVKNATTELLDLPA
jgi:hypothetical protein